MPHLLRILLIGACLVGPLQANVVINEIFYRSPDDLDRLEFIELHNTSAEPVDLGEWHFSAGIEFTFSADSIIEGKGYLVLSADADLFQEFYETDPGGVFEKSLSNGGETITLENANSEEIDSVIYSDEVPWPKSADGYSASLERICPAANSNDPANWAPSLLSDDYDRTPSGTPGKQNSVWSATLPPVIEKVSFAGDIAPAGEPLVVTASLSDTSTNLKAVELCYRIIQSGSGSDTSETVIPMTLKAAHHEATIPAQEGQRIIRYRIRATNTAGDTRYHPHPNALRPALSTYVQAPSDTETGLIPVAHFINIGEEAARQGATYRENHSSSRRGRSFGRGGARPREPSEEDRLRQSLAQRLASDPLQKAWNDMTLNGDSLPAKTIVPLAKEFRAARDSLAKLQRDAMRARDPKAFEGALDPKIDRLRKKLGDATALLLFEYDASHYDAIGARPTGRENGRGGRRFTQPSEFVNRFFDIEGSWFQSALREDLTTERVVPLAEAHRKALRERESLGKEMRQEGQIDFRAIMERAQGLSGGLSDSVGEVFGDQPRPRRGMGRGGFPGGPFGGRSGASESGPALRPQGHSAVVFTDPETQRSHFFDFINITERKSGYKVRLHKDRSYKGITTLNVLYERSEPTTLNEVLAYDLYRAAGNDTVKSGLMRIRIDGALAGYHLWFEQPNGTFFRRHEINDKGNLYKLIWMGSHRPSLHTPEDKIPERMDIVGRHEKKTNPHDGYDDIVSLVESLEEAQGDDAKMWRLIQDNFDVDQVTNYFAVNALLSHWDGFFNNYFLYHDSKGSGKWTMYPWDQDSTWSQRMGNVQELSRMPINYGAEGARPPGMEDERDGRRGRGGVTRGFGRGGFGWWRDGGDISRPLLANPQFYAQFQRRLKELATTLFTPDGFGRQIESVREKVAPEVRLRATAFDRDPESAEQELHRTMDSVMEHLQLRRAFILEQLRDIE